MSNVFKTFIHFILFLSLFAALTGFAQPRPDTAWVRVYGEGEVYERCDGIAEAHDGSIIIFGTMHDGPEGAYYGYCKRIDADGNLVWSRLPLGIHTYLEAGLLTPDCLLVVTGYGNAIIAAIDLDGDTLWTGTVPQNDLVGYCIARTADGRFAVGGDAESDVTDAGITFFDSSGHYLFHRMYPDTVNPELYSGWIEAILALDDGGLLFAAEANIPPYYPDGMWLARLNSQGDIVWTSRIRTGTDSVYIRVSSIIQLADSSFLSACNFVAPSRSYLVLNKINQDGGVVWDSVYTIPMRYYWQNTQFAACPDGGWVAAISDRRSSAFDHARLLRFNAQGDTLWSWSIGEEGDDYTGVAAIRCRDGGYVMAGEDSDYDPIWRIWTFVMKTEPEGSNADDPPSVVSDDFVLESVYPNPFNNQASIEFILKRPANVRLHLFDVLGREAAIVYEGWTPAGKHRFPLHDENLASGEYFLQGEALGVSISQKIILLK